MDEIVDNESGYKITYHLREDSPGKWIATAIFSKEGSPTDKPVRTEYTSPNGRVEEFSDKDEALRVCRAWAPEHAVRGKVGS